jgi:YegS/Rv2252/BmrU family lipid kinase
LTPIPVLVNARSGPEGARTDHAAIEAAFARHGLAAQVILLEPGQDIAARVDEFLSAGVSYIVAGGGDGTINAVASRVLDSDTVLGVLPLGTLNHFARDLGIPFALDAAVAVIAADHVVHVDVGQVDDAVFLNNSSMGLYARIVSEREHARRRLGLGKWPALARATLHALRDPATFRVVVCVDGQELQRRTPCIFVGNNAYVLEGFGIGERTRLDAGLLCLYVLRPKSTLGLLWLGVRSLFGVGSHTQDFDAFQATDFQIESQRRTIDVAMDGEVRPLPTPVRYRIRPRALRVLAPVDTASVADRGPP